MIDSYRPHGHPQGNELYIDEGYSRSALHYNEPRVSSRRDRHSRDSYGYIRDHHADTRLPSNRSEQTRGRPSTTRDRPPHPDSYQPRSHNRSRDRPCYDSYEQRGRSRSRDRPRYDSYEQRGRSGSRDRPRYDSYRHHDRSTSRDEPSRRDSYTNSARQRSPLSGRPSARENRDLYPGRSMSPRSRSPHRNSGTSNAHHRLISPNRPSTQRNPSGAKHAQQLSKDEIFRLLLDAFFSQLKGDANILQRKLDARVLFNKLLDIPEFHAVYKQAIDSGHYSHKVILGLFTRLLGDNAYTSLVGLRKHVTGCLDLNFLRAKYNLDDEYGFEIPELDMPFESQNTVLCELQYIEEREMFLFLRKHYPEGLKRHRIRTVRRYEFLWDNHDKFFFNEEGNCLPWLKNAIPNFNEAEFRALLKEATYIRHHAIHRNFVSIEYLRYAIRHTIIPLLDMLGRNSSSITDRLDNLYDDLENWEEWSEKEKKEAFEELGRIFHMLSLQSGNTDEAQLEKAKSEWAVKMLERRVSDRDEIGLDFEEHVFMVLDGETPERFIFPKHRKPLSATEWTNDQEAIETRSGTKRQYQGLNSEIGIEPNPSSIEASPTAGESPIKKKRRRRRSKRRSTNNPDDLSSEAVKASQPKGKSLRPVSDEDLNNQDLADDSAGILSEGPVIGSLGTKHSPHAKVTESMESRVQDELKNALRERNRVIAKLRAELKEAKEQNGELQRQILAAPQPSNELPNQEHSAKSPRHEDHSGNTMNFPPKPVTDLLYGDTPTVPPEATNSASAIGLPPEYGKRPSQRPGSDFG